MVSKNHICHWQLQRNVTRVRMTISGCFEALAWFMLNLLPRITSGSPHYKILFLPNHAFSAPVTVQVPIWAAVVVISQLVDFLTPRSQSSLHLEQSSEPSSPLPINPSPVQFNSIFWQFQHAKANPSWYNILSKLGSSWPTATWPLCKRGMILAGVWSRDVRGGAFSSGAGQKNE